jgi:hypothetical protein
MYPLKSYRQRKSNLSLIASFLQDLNGRLSWFVQGGSIFPGNAVGMELN